MMETVGLDTNFGEDRPIGPDSPFRFPPVWTFTIRPPRLAAFCPELCGKCCVSVALIVSLSGCATTQPLPEKIYIRVPAPCIETSQLPKPPVAKTDAELAKMSDFDLILEIALQRLEYRMYSTELSALLIACTK